MEIKTLSLDIETFCEAPLAKCGVYKYAEHPSFDILLLGYSVNGGAVQQVDLAQGEKIPLEILQAILSKDVIKWAFNANFERICLSRYLKLPQGEYLNPASWHCTMVWCVTLGLPMSLEGAGSIIGLEKQKLTEGKELIRKFCIPCIPIKNNGYITRIMPQNMPSEWLEFKKYNVRDVETELEIQTRLAKFPVSEQVWNEYTEDQRINDRGVMVDRLLVQNAISFDEKSHNELILRMQQLTAVQNPSSVAQLKAWLLGKKQFNEILGTLVEKPHGKPVIVPASDSRPEFITNDFNDLHD